MNARSLVTPQADFWLLGGLSIISLAAIGALTTWIKPTLSSQIIWTAYYAAFIVNYPHFAYSYQLFYKDFYSYLRSPETQLASKIRLFVAGILAPVLMIGFFTFVGFTRSMYLLSCGLSAYMFLSGWHYVKQGYGALITTSVYKRIFYSNWEKRILYANVYVVWIYAWVRLNAYVTSIPLSISGVALALPHFPLWFTPLFSALACVSSLLAAGVIFYVWKVEKKGISVNGITGYIAACYVWLILPAFSPVFAACIPFFHSLQYLPFVYKFKKSELADAEKSYNQDIKSENITPILFGVFIVVGIALGALFFEGIPGLMDKMHGHWGNGFTDSFFLISFPAFINLHHFFIDHAFWRKDNAKVQKFLFSA